MLRQQWSLAFLNLDYKAKNIINIDETWLGMADFRRRHWRPDTNGYSIKAKQMAPRISMITGVDKLGNLYLCLSQSNSNKSMMYKCLTVRRLVRLRDKVHI